MGPRRRRFKSCRSDHFSDTAGIAENDVADHHESEPDSEPRTTGAQNPPESEPNLDESKVKFPKVIQNKKTKVEVTIYGKSKGGDPKKGGGVTQPYPVYRVCWRVAGQRKMQSFATYSAAKKAADVLVRDLGKGSQVTALTPGQARDALLAFGRIQDYYQSTGRRVSLLAGISEYCASAKLLPEGRTVLSAVEGFVSSVASVKRMDLLKAVNEWIKGRKLKTAAKVGKRAQLSSGYHYNTCLVLNEFAAKFPGHAVCDLGKQHLDLYMAAHAGLSPKSRNERRMTLRMFLKWCVAKDYLSATHRLFESAGMAREVADAAEIAPYTAEELKAMLDRASKVPAPIVDGKDDKEDDKNKVKLEPDYRPLLPIIALVALGGIRLEESTRMEWEDVWRIAGHIEVSVSTSKTRSRRLATVCPALAAWLEDYRNSTGPLWAFGLQHFHKSFEKMLTELEIPIRRNAMRHGFISAHYAAHSNEGLTARLAGNSPGVVHSNYKGLMTQHQGETWFNVTPERPGNVLSLGSAAAGQSGK